MNGYILLVLLSKRKRKKMKRILHFGGRPTFYSGRGTAAVIADGGGWWGW